MRESVLDITIGPIAFFWPSNVIRKFYESLAESNVARVIVGEWVCSKRLPFWQDEISGAISALQNKGKKVALSSLSLVTLKRERAQTAALFEVGLPVEIADITALRYLPEGAEFWVGPTVNVYNEGTVEWLARKGATRICLNPEIPLKSIAKLSEAGRKNGVSIEVWGHGKAPLAISGRCYHARLHERAKDSCQFVCAEDADGRDVDTLDGQGFLTVNGVQTLGHSVSTIVAHASKLKEAGVSSARISPQTGDFLSLISVYNHLLEGRIEEKKAIIDLQEINKNMSLCNGFMIGDAGINLNI